jgi:hypothetical protein
MAPFYQRTHQTDGIGRGWSLSHNNVDGFGRAEELGLAGALAILTVLDVFGTRGFRSSSPLDQTEAACIVQTERLAIVIDLSPGVLGNQ